MALIKNENPLVGIRARLSVLVLFWAFALLPVTALADVFKCKVGNSTVYQNLPCDGKAETKPHIGTSGSASPYRQGKLDTLSLAQISVAMREVDKEMRGSYAELDKQLDRLSINDQAGRANALKAHQARFETNERISNELVTELRRRCPGGAMLSEGGTQRCNKK